MRDLEDLLRRDPSLLHDELYSDEALTDLDYRERIERLIKEHDDGKNASAARKGMANAVGPGFTANR